MRIVNGMIGCLEDVTAIGFWGLIGALGVILFTWVATEMTSQARPAGGGAYVLAIACFITIFLIVFKEWQLGRMSFIEAVTFLFLPVVINSLIYGVPRLLKSAWRVR